MATDPRQESPVDDAASDPTAPPGWDPGEVWRDRVQAPRLARELQPATAEAEPAASESQPRSGPGWDPLETWRYRVLRVFPSGKA
jgi:hypothetical protein